MQKQDALENACKGCLSCARKHTDTSIYFDERERELLVVRDCWENNGAGSLRIASSRLAQTGKSCRALQATAARLVPRLDGHLSAGAGCPAS